MSGLLALPTLSRRGLRARLGVAIALGLSLAACGVDANVSTSHPTDGSVASAVPRSEPSTGLGDRAELPNGVPMPVGGLIVSGPTAAVTRGGVTGWSAVVAVSASGAPNDVRERLRQQLLDLGWQADGGKGSAAPASQTALSVHRRLPLIGPTAAPGPRTGADQWLHVSVTEPLVGSGPAVAYRFAEAAAG